MSEKLKVAIRLSADPKDALKAFAALKKKSLDARAALQQTQKQLAATAQRMQAAGGKDIHLARQFEAARHKARALKQTWQEQQTALEQSRRSLAAMGISTNNLAASARQVSRTLGQAQAKLRQAAKQTRARNILGITSDTTRREIQRTIAALNRLKRSGRASMHDIARATDAARRRIRQLRTTTEAANKSQSLLGRHLRYATGAGLTTGAVLGVRGTYRMADAYVELNNRLRLVTHSEANLAETRRRLYEISQITRTEIGANAALYSKFAMATQKTGHSQADLLKVVSLLNKQVAIGGSNASEAAAGLLQFGQGLASGKFAGDELKSVLENLLGVSDALIAGFKKLHEQGDIAFEVTHENIRDLAVKGKLSARLLIEAVLASAEVTEQKFKKVEKTMQGGWTQVGNAIAMVIGQMNDAFEGAQTFSDILGALAERIGNIDVEALTKKIGYLKNAVITLSIVVGARLSVAFYKGAASALKLSSSLATAQGAMNTTSAGAGRLAAAMALAKRTSVGLWAAIGGPLGGIALGSYILYELVSAHKSAAKATDKHTDALAALRHQIKDLPRDADAAIARLARVSKEQIKASRAAYEIRQQRAQKKLSATQSTLDEVAERGIVSGRQWRGQGRGRRRVPTFRPATDVEINNATVDLQKAQAEVNRLAETIEYHEAALTGGAPQIGKPITEAMQKAGRAFEELNQKISAALMSDRQRIKAEFEQHAKIIRESYKLPAEQQALAKKAKTLYQQRIQALDVAAARARLALTRDSLARQQAALEHALNTRIISISEYYRKKAALDIQAIDAEIALRREDKNTPENTIEIQRLELQKENVLADAAREAKAAEDDLAESLRQVRYELAHLQGQGAITREALAAEYADLRARLLAEDDTEGVNLIDRLIDVRHAEQRLRELEQAWQATQERLRVQQETINIDQDAGLITETEARARLLQLKQQSRAEMQRLLPLMQQAAAAIGPEAVTRVQQWRNALARLNTTAHQVAATLNQKLKDGLATMFTDIVTQAKTAGDALRGMIRGFAAELNRLLARQLVQKLFGAYLGGAGGGGGGAGGVIAGALGLAQGGLVRGPGTSTSDDVPAMLSSGEFVVNAAAVRRWGTDFLDIINHGAPMGPSPRLAMAAGGLVPAAAPAATPDQSQSVRIVNVIDPKMAADYLTSSEGERTILNVLERNRGAVKQVIE